MTTLDRKYFSDTQGMLYCERLCIEKDNLQDLIGRQVPRYLALAACSALIKYGNVTNFWLSLPCDSSFLSQWKTYNVVPLPVEL
jgi:hypothetical protein